MSDHGHGAQPTTGDRRAASLPRAGGRLAARPAGWPGCARDPDHPRGAARSLFPFFDNDAYWVRELSLIAVLALVVSGVNLSFGYAGEIQFGQVFMFAFGAYVTMILAGRVPDRDHPAAAHRRACGRAGRRVIAIPAVRIGGWSLALTSFFLVITIPDLVDHLPEVHRAA